ncbi:general secretion pathway protein GspN [Pseudomonas atacamensis]|jgi:general secretion pathway protein N|uniref:general secretion pathway protein GspN n=1 Tax=Pseudomonas atacamensis TaxID=2565368 RepID=UPI002480CAF1|nr:general secretion pathway protein GspN [Pseudomonas atacamensis]WGT36158.1 general secretion pathway protein GspN [Pseudomonas atacamensis]
MNLLLLTIAATLGAVFVVLLLGAGRAEHWLPADQPRHLPASAAPKPPPTLTAQDLSLSWQQSIFSPERKPDLVSNKGEAAALQGVVLTGVVMDGETQWALLRLANKSTFKLAIGKSLDNGWTLTALSPLQATFMYQGQIRQLSLPVLRLPPPSTASLITLPNVPRP